MSIQCGDIVKALERLADPRLAEDWDNVGLQVGELSQPVQRIMLALTPGEEAVAAAANAGADMLITHHPLIFKPIKNVTGASAVGRAIMALVRKQMSLYCAHTSLDAAAGGVNDALARALGLEAVSPLAESQADEWLKLVVYVPRGYEEDVREALCRAGAGHIGAHYQCCTFQAAGTGTFAAQEGAKPFIGAVGELSRAEEYRLETVVPRECLSQVIAAMQAAHPYEEAAYDVFRLEGVATDNGVGRIGRLPEPMTLQGFLQRVTAALGVSQLSYQGNLQHSVETVALCGGSGAGYLSLARRKGADVYVTGDVKYHDGQLARELGVALVDGGHFGTERLVLPVLASYLRQVLALAEDQVVIWQGEVDYLQPYHTED